MGNLWFLPVLRLPSDLQIIELPRWYSGSLLVNAGDTRDVGSNPGLGRSPRVGILPWWFRL